MYEILVQSAVETDLSLKLKKKSVLTEWDKKCHNLDDLIVLKNKKFIDYVNRA